jgi:hypothetical protein
VVSEEEVSKQGYEYLPPPRRRFALGQRVRVGHLGDPVVEGESADGRFIRVSFLTDDGVRDGRLVVPWVSVFPEKHTEKELTQPAFHMHEYVRDIHSLVTMALGHGIDMDPPYQRGLVWRIWDKRLLVKSIFEQRDLGKIVLRRLPYQAGRQSYEVVDGKQRLSAILEFYLDGFSYQGVRYSELTGKDMATFKGTRIAVGEMSDRTTDEEAMRAFLLLNESGKAPGRQHLKKVQKMLAEGSAGVS